MNAKDLMTGDNNLKERNLLICNDWVEGLTAQEIIDQWPTRHPEISLNILPSRIYQILWENNQYVEPQVAWNKARRIHKLQSWIKDKESKKDPADLLEQVRREVEGDAPLIDQSQKVINITYQWGLDDASVVGKDTIPPTALPEADTLS